MDCMANAAIALSVSCADSSPKGRACGRLVITLTWYGRKSSTKTIASLASISEKSSVFAYS